MTGMSNSGTDEVDVDEYRVLRWSVFANSGSFSPGEDTARPVAVRRRLYVSLSCEQVAGEHRGW
jgi:hypothetical protein